MATFLLGLLISIGSALCCEPMITLFLDRGTAPHTIAMHGFPFFAMGFVFTSMNLVGIGIYQGLEKANSAIAFMFLRGIVLVIPSFFLLPSLLGEKGLWLAIPLAEAVTFGVMAIYSIAKTRRFRKTRQSSRT